MSEGGDSSSSGVHSEQVYDDVVLPDLWWWLAHISICVVALIGNGIFLLTVIYNRNRHDLKTFVTAVFVTVAVLDVLDVLRVIPVLVEQLFDEKIFRYVFCSLGVFHELAVAVFLVAAGIAVCVQSGKEPKYYLSGRASLSHKILIPVVLLLAAGAAAPYYLLRYHQLSYTCTDAFRFKEVTDVNDAFFVENLYSTLVAFFTYLLPVIILPLVLPIAMLKTCVARQCCVARFKQPIGELIMVLLVGVVYLGTVVGVVLPRMDEEMDTGLEIKLTPAPLLWELGNTAARPIIYFLTNPAVWDGLGYMCCKKKHRLVDEDDEEIEVPLSPVTTV